MCDTVVVVNPDQVLFGKNSDRDPNEPAVLEWHRGVTYSSRSSLPELRCTYMRIGQAQRTHAILINRPFWMWGAEMGTNEHGVTIGNEAVFTRHAVPKVGLTGMDLLRLMLERAESAEEAVSVLSDLLKRYPQGGSGGHEHAYMTYFSSFIVCDRREAYVVETDAQDWVSERVRGVRTISNALSIAPFADERTERVKTAIARAKGRAERSACVTSGARDPADIMRVLRDHGPSGGVRYNPINGAFGAPCVHAGGLVASSQSVASWVSELGPGSVRHFATGTSAPCTGLFKPVDVHEPVFFGPAPTDQYDPETLFWAHERLHRRVMQNPEALMPLFAGERDALERQFIEERTPSNEAFRLHRERLDAWTQEVIGSSAPDVRPHFVKRYWKKRARFAGMVPGALGQFRPRAFRAPFEARAV